MLSLLLYVVLSLYCMSCCRLLLLYVEVVVVSSWLLYDCWSVCRVVVSSWLLSFCRVDCRMIVEIVQDCREIDPCVCWIEVRSVCVVVSSP